MALTIEQAASETKQNLTISVVIPTLNRAKDLRELLSTLLDQSLPPIEIIVVDDSNGESTANLIHEFNTKIRSTSQLIYVRGDGSGITSARNMGVKASHGDAILFLDDDILLEKDVVERLSEFLRKNPTALGVQPRIPGFADYWTQSSFGIRLENLINKVIMLTYHMPNRLSVRRSGAAVFPQKLTKVITVQRMMGCSFCLMRSVLSEFRSDTNLLKWGCYEDLDLTYRIYRRYPGSLFAIPTATVVHKHSAQSRLQSRKLHRMTTVYWFYVFFKDLSDESILNPLAFMWAMGGFLFWTVMGAITNQDGTRLMVTRYLLRDYAESLYHLRSIRQRNLNFFNRTLN